MPNIKYLMLHEAPSITDSVYYFTILFDVYV